MNTYDYVLGKPVPTSFVQYCKNKVGYFLQVVSFYLRCWASELQGKEPTPYKIDHISYTSEEYGSIGEEFIFYDIPNRRNLVYVLGKKDIEQSWQSWVRNPFYMNTNTTHSFKIHDIRSGSITETPDPMNKTEEDPDYEFWDTLVGASLRVIEDEHEVDMEELEKWYNKNTYLYGNTDW